MFTLTTPRAILLGFLAAALGGCATSPSLALKIETPSEKPKVLIGQFIGSVALVQGSPKEAEIHASDGNLTCTGQSKTGQFSTDLMKNRIAHRFELKCSNGATGQLVLNISASPSNVSGIGAGTLSDGSKVKVVVGDLAGTLAW